MIRRLFGRRPLDAQIDRELRFHLDQHAADLVARGHAPHEAQRLARVALGGPAQVTEAVRSVHRFRWLEDARQDIRYTLRMIRHRPGFAAAVIATLALGIGATTTIFTVANGVLLRPLPFANPDELVTVSEQTDWSTAYGNVWSVAFPNLLDCQRQATSLTLGAFRFRGGTLTGSGDPEFANGYETTASLWRVIRASMEQGRAFLDDEDVLGGAPAIIISHDLWQRRFGGRASAIGERLTFEGTPYSIVGVTPPGFQLSQPADVYLPLGQNPDPALHARDRRAGLRVWARLAPGTSMNRAQTELTTIGTSLAASYPQSNRGRTFVIEPLRPSVGTVASTLWLLLGAVGVVLVLICVNVASLLLARARSRRTELAVRAMLGAGRARLIRQCLAESTVLALLGGGLGVLVAAATVQPFVNAWPGGLPRAEQVFLDWRVLSFALGISCLTGILVGLAPAFAAPRNAFDGAMRAGGRSIKGDSRKGQAAFVATELALAVVLIACASILGRTLVRVSHLDPGVDIHNVLIARAALSPAVLSDPAATRVAWDDVLARTRAYPGVVDAAIVDTVPMRSGNNQLTYSATATLPDPSLRPLALATSVSPGFDRVMGLHVVSGRFLDDRDRKGTEAVVVIDDVLARAAFGTANAAGKHLWIPDLGDGPITVAGVVGHVRHWGLADDDSATVRAQFYYPFAQLDDRLVRRWSQLMSLAVRTASAPGAFVEPLRHALRGPANDQVLYVPQTLDALADSSIARERFLLVLFGVFAGVALLLACLGVYGVLAFLTNRRVPEIAVRLALGATPRQVIALVIGDSMRMLAIGVTAGAIVAIGAARLLTSLIVSVQGIDPAAMVAAVIVLILTALIATYLPARRAGRIDASTALRSE